MCECRLILRCSALFDGFGCYPFVLRHFGWQGKCLFFSCGESMNTVRHAHISLCETPFHGRNDWVFHTPYRVCFEQQVVGQIAISVLLCRKVTGPIHCCFNHSLVGGIIPLFIRF